MALHCGQRLRVERGGDECAGDVASACGSAFGVGDRGSGCEIRNSRSIGREVVLRSAGREEISRSTGRKDVSRATGREGISGPRGREEVSRATGREEILGSAGGVGVSGSGEGEGISGWGSGGVEGISGWGSGCVGISGWGFGVSGISGAGGVGDSKRGRKMFEPSGISVWACSAMRCFTPATQRRLRSASETDPGFSGFGCWRFGGAERSGDDGRAENFGAGVANIVGDVSEIVPLSTSMTSVAPRRCAQSTALSPRLSRKCGSAPASSKSGIKCVWPKIVARMSGVCPPPVRSFTSAPLARTAFTAAASPEVTA